MNFFKTLSTLAGGNSIPYNFGDKIVDSVTSIDSTPSLNRSSIQSIWNIYNGTSRENNALEVSIFEFELKEPRNSRFVRLATNCFQKWRSLKLLPGILTLIDSFENETHLYLVTERIRPLVDVLELGYPEDSMPVDSMLLGIHQIITALKFINVEATTIHGNVCLSNIFVNSSGDWKLAGFEVSTSDKDIRNYTNNFEQANQLPNFDQNIPPEYEKLGPAFCKNFNNQSIKFDSFKMGEIIADLFKRADRSIPSSMGSHLKKLSNRAVTLRSSIEQFLQAGESSFFNILLIQFYQHVSQLNIKPANEKVEFFKSLDNADISNNLPLGSFENKILPELIKAFNSLKDNADSSQSILLFIILKNSTTVPNVISDKSFNIHLKPLLFKVFTLPDRSIRMTLLTALPEFINKLTNYEIQDKIFPQLITGFNDTNLTIREETMKAIIPITSKISDRQLNNDLLRYLAKLQNDPEKGIRANAIVCLTTIAKDIASNSRAGVLITAFGKGIKDQYRPLRLTTVTSFETTIDFFTPEVCCSRVLSALAPALLDESPSVRDKTKIVFEKYVQKIESAAQKLPHAESDDLDGEFVDNNTAKIESGLASVTLGSLGLKSNSLFGFGTSLANDSTASLTMKNTETVVTPTVQSKNSSPQPSSTFAPAQQQSGFGYFGTAAKKSQIDFDDLNDDDGDDGWGLGDDGEEKEEPIKVMPSRPNSKPKSSLSLATKATTTKSSPLSLKKQPGAGALKLKPKNKLKIDLDEDGDDGWGEGW